MRLVVAATGASGSIYLQRLLHYLGDGGHEVHFIASPYARQVIHEEIGKLKLPEGTIEHSDKSMNAPSRAGVRNSTP